VQGDSEHAIRLKSYRISLQVSFGRNLLARNTLSLASQEFLGGLGGLAHGLQLSYSVKRVKPGHGRGQGLSGLTPLGRTPLIVNRRLTPP